MEEGSTQSASSYDYSIYTLKDSTPFGKEIFISRLFNLSLVIWYTKINKLLIIKNYLNEANIFAIPIMSLFRANIYFSSCGVYNDLFQVQVCATRLLYT